MQRAVRVAMAGLMAAAALTVAHPEARNADSAAERTIYVSVMDGKGMPVPDMTQKEFAVKEDGETREITKVERATEPLHYAVLVDTTSAATPVLNDLREALTGFCQLLLSADPKTQFAFMEFGGAAVMRQAFTSSLSDIEAVIPKLVPRPSESVLSEALMEISKTFAAMPAGTRRVIVTINMEPTAEASNLGPQQVAQAVRTSGAAVWSVAMQSGNRRDANREALLKGLTANAGGRWVALQSPTQLAPFLRSIAANSFSQYAVTYTQPEGATPPKVTDVTVSRQGVGALAIKWSTQ